ncbi:uncharacterized protein LOC131003240 isoform X2 [Salvia miltiorrhiza]|nr:uncharacterized protein LOC131003240 isoform X2 [Salvia miltiorrhiza]
MPFGASNSQEEPICDRADVTVFNSSDSFQEVSFLLDAMTNKGICSFVRILTGGLDIFDKTKWGMMRTIKELLPKVIADKNEVSRTKLKRCSLILRDPTNFWGNETMRFTASESYCAAAFKVLERLEDFSSRTIHAMLRKLKSVKGYIPSLQTPRIRHLGRLIKAVRKNCTAMLSDIGGANEPAEELSGALEVASLTLKLIMNCPGVRDFRRFSPEVVALQNDIAKAIHLLNEPKKVRMIELEKVQLLLDPNIVLPAKGLRKAVQNLLIDYLYECSDMENVPNILIETLDIINRRAQLGSRKKSSSKGFSSKELMKEEIEKEMQHLLNISAQAKEVVVNLLPEHEFDEEFARAYMEDIDGSGAHCFFDNDLQIEDSSQHFKFHSYSSYDHTESIGETNPVELNSPVPRSKRNTCLPPSPNGGSDMTPEAMHLHSPAYEDSKLQNSQCLGKEYPLGFKADEFEPACSDSMKVTTEPTTAKTRFSDIKVEETDIVDQQSRSINGYLELQEACDATSMVAYRFVGFMLDTLAKTENLELDQGDRLYLHSHASFVEDTEEFSDVLVSKFSEMWKNVLEH